MPHEFTAFFSCIKVTVCFRVIALYSQKFPNGTFEEVNNKADEMAKLAEHCCQYDASPDCYDKGVSQHLF